MLFYEIHPLACMSQIFCCLASVRPQEGT